MRIIACYLTMILAIFGFSGCTEPVPVEIEVESIGSEEMQSWLSLEYESTVELPDSLMDMSAAKDTTDDD